MVSPFQGSGLLVTDNLGPPLAWLASVQAITLRAFSPLNLRTTYRKGALLFKVAHKTYPNIMRAVASNGNSRDEFALESTTKQSPASRCRCSAAPPADPARRSRRSQA